MERTVTLTMTQLRNALIAAHERGLQQLPLSQAYHIEVAQQQDLFMETPLQNVMKVDDKEL